jgi:antitoxin ParD1/3/4
MSNNTSFSLGDHFNAFIETQVARGRFASASDMVRAGLHLMEEQEAKQDALRSALIAGEEAVTRHPSTSTNSSQANGLRRLKSNDHRALAGTGRYALTRTPARQ